MDDPLKSCPFCGNSNVSFGETALVPTTYWITCGSNCNCDNYPDCICDKGCGCLMCDFKTKDEARKAWNKRHE